jgi:hypothetical protein
MAVAIVVLNRMFPHSENGEFNAEFIVMRSPGSRDPADRRYSGFCTPHNGTRFQQGDQCVGGLETTGP